MRPGLQPREMQPTQELADRPLVHLDLELLADHGLQVHVSPTHHPVLGRVGSGNHQRFQLDHLLA